MTEQAFRNAAKIWDVAGALKTPSPATKETARLPEQLRCYVRLGASDSYYAECIDLNLIVRAKTQAGAVDSLVACIGGYVTTALEGNVVGLIPRPSGLVRRIRYHLFRLLVQLHQSVAEFKAFVVKPESSEVLFC